MVSGIGAQSLAVIEAASNIATALKGKGAAVNISLAVSEANSLGLAMMDAGNIDAAFKRISAGEVDTAVVLENDLYRRAPQAQVDAAFASLKSLVVVDHTLTATAEKASIVLPAASVFEGDGTFVSMEGRAQRHYQVYDPTYYNKDVASSESWRWLSQIKGAAWLTVDDAIAAAALGVPALAKIIDAAPSAKFRVAGMKVAREPHRYSGRTAMRANISVHEPRQPQDVDNPLNFSMEGYNGTGKADRPAALVPYAWAPGWNSPSAWNKFQSEVGGHMRGGDAGVHVFVSGTGAPSYFKNVPAAFAPSANGLRALVLHRHFGAEELSSRAKPIIERAGEAKVVFNAADAQRLGINGKATVTVDGVSVTLPTQLSKTLPQGTVGLPAGLQGLLVIGAQSLAQVSGGH